MTLPTKPKRNSIDNPSARCKKRKKMNLSRRAPSIKNNRTTKHCFTAFFTGIAIVLIFHQFKTVPKPKHIKAPEKLETDLYEKPPLQSGFLNSEFAACCLP